MYSITKYENLANAIILQAVDDYRNALYELQRNPRYAPALYTVSEVERFFRSGWFSTLTAIGPEMLIQKLKSEVP